MSDKQAVRNALRLLNMAEDALIAVLDDRGGSFGLDKCREVLAIIQRPTKEQDNEATRNKTKSEKQTTQDDDVQSGGHRQDHSGD